MTALFSKCIKQESISYITEKRESTLHVIESSGISNNSMSLARQTKTKINKWDYIKIKKLLKYKRNNEQNKKHTKD